MTPAQLAHHPVIVAGLAHHGLTPADVMDSPEWRRDESAHYFAGGDAGRPQVDVSQREARVSWERSSTGEAKLSFHIYHTSAGWHHEVRIRGLELPETMLSGIAGRRLGDVVALNEAAELVMLDARHWQDGICVDIAPIGNEDHAWI